MLAYSTVTDPRWYDLSYTHIICKVVFPHVGDTPLDFIAAKDDPAEHRRDIYNRCLAGEFGVVGPYVAPSQTQDEADREIISLGRQRIADAYGPKRLSYLSYFSRIASKASADRSKSEASDLAVMVAGDEWEEAMLAEIADLVKAHDLPGAKADASWPALPSGMAALIAAC